MEFRRIEYFVAIVEEGTISAAAKKLNMAQPPLSQQLKLLEEELHVTLFDRTTRSLHLTKEGTQFYEHALNILETVEYAEQSMKFMTQGAFGTLQIGMVSSVATDLLPEKIKQFKKDYPNITFELYDGDPNRIMELLEKRIIDIGFARKPINEKLFNAIYLEETCFFAAVNVGHFPEFAHVDAIPLIALKDKPFMLLRRQQGTAPYHEYVDTVDIIKKSCLDLKFEPIILCESSNMMTLLSWAHHGLGIAIVPQISTDLFKESHLQFKKIIAPQLFTNTPALIWLKNRILPPLAEHFKNYFT